MDEKGGWGAWKDYAKQQWDQRPKDPLKGLKDGFKEVDKRVSNPNTSTGLMVGGWRYLWGAMILIIVMFLYGLVLAAFAQRNDPCLEDHPDLKMNIFDWVALGFLVVSFYFNLIGVAGYTLTFDELRRWGIVQYGHFLAGMFVLAWFIIGVVLFTSDSNAQCRDNTAEEGVQFRPIATIGVLGLIAFGIALVFHLLYFVVTLMRWRSENDSRPIYLQSKDPYRDRWVEGEDATRKFV